MGSWQIAVAGRRLGPQEFTELTQLRHHWRQGRGPLRVDDFIQRGHSNGRHARQDRRCASAGDIVAARQRNDSAVIPATMGRSVPRLAQDWRPMAPAPVPATDDASAGLTDTEREILAFERQWWKYAGAKEAAIRELFGMSATRYYQVLNALINTEAALAADPMLVKRLRRLRDVRQQERSARRLGVVSGEAAGS